MVLNWWQFTIKFIATIRTHLGSRVGVINKCYDLNCWLVHKMQYATFNRKTQVQDRKGQFRLG